MVMTAEIYLKENIDDKVTIIPWQDKNTLPIYLRNNYNLFEMKILGTLRLLLEIVDEHPGVDTLLKHIQRIETLTDHQVVLFYKEMTRYRRKSLIEKRIPFVIEDGQMYLPFLGLDLKRAPETIEYGIKQFSASAQLAYLYFLYHKDVQINMTEFANRMGLTNMTASRALNELYHASLITYEMGGKTGRSKVYKRISDPEYFLKGRKYIKSPVQKNVYAKSKPQDALIAGLDALSELSMLNPPNQAVVAISRDEFNQQKIEIIKNKDIIKDSQLVEIQIWEYDPKQVSDNNHVDLLSLYASLKEENDERIEQALEEILRGEAWYMA